MARPPQRLLREERDVALPLLAATAAAIGNTRRIRLKKDWTEPPVLWVAVVGDSGTMKSPAFEVATKFVRRRQQRLFGEHAQEVAIHKTAKQRWKATPRAERDVEPEPPPPLAHVFTSDATVEALADRLGNSPRGLLLMVDELHGWFGSFNQYKGGRGSDVPRYLSMHRASALKVDRTSTEKPTIYVPHAAISIAGGIQPQILRDALTGDFFANGLAARLLLAMPPARPKKWTEAEISHAAENAVSDMFMGLYDYEGSTGIDGQPEPVCLDLTDDAKEVWVDFYGDYATEQAQCGDPKVLAAMSKLEGYAARLALVIHCARHTVGEAVDPWRIDRTSVEAGITLAMWFDNEMRRVYADLSLSPAAREQSELVAWIAGRGGRATPRDLMRGPRRYRDSYDRAEGALRDLVAAGLGTWVTPQYTGVGAPAASYFELAATDGDDRSAGFTEDLKDLSPSPELEADVA